MGITEKEKGWWGGVENLLKEIIAEKFLNLGKELDMQVHKAKNKSNYFNAKSHIILSLPKINDKER